MGLSILADGRSGVNHNNLLSYSIDLPILAEGKLEVQWARQGGRKITVVP